MKKRFSIILCLLLALLLTACAPTEVPDTTTTENSDEIPTSNRLPIAFYYGTFEEMLHSATDVVIGRCNGTSETNQSEVVQFLVTKRFLGDERNKTVSFSLSEGPCQVEGTDIIYSPQDLNFKYNEEYLLVLRRYVSAFSDSYVLMGDIYLPLYDFSAFTLYHGKPENHVKGEVPNNEEELYRFIQNHINPESPKYLTREGSEHEGLRGDELLRDAAKNHRSLSRIELVEFVAVATGSKYQIYLCRDLNSDSEELIPIRFPLEYPLAESDQYAAIVSGPIQLHSSHGSESEYWKLYGRYALWPVEAYTELEAKWQTFAEE